MNVEASCGRCGLGHRWKAECQAKASRCNKCKKIGHFARKCRSHLGLAHNRPRPVNVELKKRRDSVRMTEFLRRKDAAHLPFFGIDSVDIGKLCFNSALTSNHSRAMRNNKLEIQRLTDELVRMRSARADLESANANITDLQRTVETLKTQLKQAGVRRADAEATSGGLRKTIAMLERQCESEKEDNEMWAMRSEKQVRRLSAIRAETEAKSSEAIRLGAGQNGQQGSSINDDMCRKCASRDSRHSRANCPASGNKCHVCKKKGHFTILCLKDNPYCIRLPPGKEPPWCAAIRVPAIRT